MPCRGCGKAFLKLNVADGVHPLKCPQCGRTTTARVKCKGESCQVTTELSKETTPSS